MRLRKVKNAEIILEENSNIVITEDKIKVKTWSEIFDNNKEIHVEIGMGKGDFIIECAKKNPNINFIGIEKFDSVAVRALEKVLELEKEVPNLRIFKVDATNIKNFFRESEVSRIYLNFSDPWPKVRHAKRRLTHKLFLEQYKYILKNDGEIHQKTDNQGLFEFSLESYSDAGLKLRNISLDLHNSEYKLPPMTEFEKKFVEQGMRIYRAEIVFN